jgi:hypothetical protein
MEVDMIGKISVATLALVLVSAGIASAQSSHALRAHPAATLQAPYADSYYNKDYWDGVAPAGRIQLRDPYVGTPFENVAPY